MCIKTQLKILLTTLYFISINSLIIPSENVIKYDRGIVIERDSLKLKIEVIAPTIIHIISAPSEFSNRKSLIIEEKNSSVPNCIVEEEEVCVNIRSDSLHIKFSYLNDVLEFYKSKKLILKESKRIFRKIEVDKEKTFSVKQVYKLVSDEAIYGLGQHPNGILNYRNKSLELIQNNTEVAIPFIVSTNNYGLIWDNNSKTIFTDNSNGMSIGSEIADQIDYYFIYGFNIDDIIKQYRCLTGQAPLYPKWAYGYFQSKNRYWTQQELLNTVAKFRNLSIPLDVIVLDYMHWGKYGFGSFRFDEESFPNPKQMIDSLHSIFNCKLMVSVWPSFSKYTDNWYKMNSKGYLLNVNSFANTQVYDAFNPAAGKLYWDLIEQSYFNLGVDGWWLDATEPERIAEYSISRSFLGSSKRYLNVYSLADVKNIYLGQRESSSDRRIFILTRSAFTGQQKFAASTWSGDIETTFKSLRNQIIAGLNFCISGIPYWTTDIGGYKGGDPADPEYRELYIRWFQYGTFCPIFRSHGRRAPGDRKTPNEIWSYGNKAQTILTRLLNFRYRLLPYIYSNAWEITSNGGTLMRALVFDFKSDNNVYNIDDQFMFGEALLINPIINSKLTQRKVYLPAGAEWIDFWTGENYVGGETITAKAALDRIPIFVKSGSILPMGPFLQYTNEKPSDPIEIRIYGNTNSEFRLYEDEGDNYNYEKGDYSIIKIKWDAEQNIVIFYDREGGFPSMLTERSFNIVKVRHGYGVGVESTPGRKVFYNGKKIAVNL